MTSPKQHERIDPGKYADVLAAARMGDSDAIGALLRDCEAEVRDGLVQRIPNHLRGAFDDTDVLQVTFLDAIIHFTSFVGSTRPSFVAWLRIAAERNRQDACRALEAGIRVDRRRRVAVGPAGDSYSTLLERLGGSGTTPSRNVGREEIKARLHEALEAFPPDYRRVVELYDLEERGIKEVAAIMDRSEGAVHMLRSRAYDRLREILGASTNFFSR